ncbi:hypothetical protein [Chitinophaga filiformis]|uniref:Uncharacterized protein n=1 Tax=Chitinophaga filiformis TaxID=104663 RepID=A0ABY4I9R9_CHIFI|nr:hypothetical protein [Chitinophaga filiformis]UPK72859.1 hypothetical protein MYF79_16330 [Chitinophaga filiformis]
MFKLEDKLVAKEAGLTLLKSILSVTPGGGFLNEYIEFRSRIKQERFNNFISQFAEYLTSNNIEANPDLNNEDFDDLFEAVIRRVVSTKSAEKHNRFRDILLNFIENPSMEIDEAEIFLGLANDLSDPAIIILKQHKILRRNFVDKNTKLRRLEYDLPILNGKTVAESTLKEKGLANNFDFVNQQRLDTDLEIKKIKAEIDALNAINAASYYNMDEDAFLYQKQILLSKGLLADNYTGATVGGSPFVYMTITEFGEKFIEFIIRG